MKVFNHLTTGIAGAVMSIAFLALLLAGCASTRTGDSAYLEKGGAQLWGENCVRCHNAPDPPSFGDVEWETIGMHMRIRANLTDSEVNKIVEFLKLANG
jgi:mono/diheme cytochrome c family protein